MIYFSSCERLITFCDVHSRFLMNKEGSQDGFTGDTCCQALFHAEPTFSVMGTCYTTKVEIVEYVPSVFSSITMWLDGLNKSRLISKY